VRFLAIILFVFASLSTQAMIKAGVSFNDTLTYNKQKLVLNGLGVREATVLNVDVYVAGLYLATKSQDPQQIIDSGEAKVLKMQFVRDVALDKLNQAWDDALKDKGFDEELKQLKAAGKEYKNKDQMMFTFSPGGATFFVNNEKKATFKNPLFGKALLAIWLGENPPNKGLKQGLLGL
jgi:hypothetical protein